MKKALKAMAITVISIGLAACGGTPGTTSHVPYNPGRGPAPEDFQGEGFTRISYTPEERGRYDNIYDEEHIPEQWGKYGVGDPFLMRYNGEYYLYCSTRDDQYGFKVWKSRDLVHFTYLGHKAYLNEDGTEEGHKGQFAPEVYCWNGDFYAYGSPHGAGHYVYKSVDGTPYGDFKAITGNLGKNIDGSLFIDDDESMYFLTASSATIKCYPMSAIDKISSSSYDLTTGLQKWTEGPCMIKHNGTYFLSYTGNNVICDGYRVGYSYSTSGPTEEFVYPSMGTVALRTVQEQVGLGHSSTVLGPNLDSYYMSYHNLNNPSGPNRSYNINRVSFQGTRMGLYGPTYKGALNPVMPDYVAYESSGLEENMGKLLSKEATSDRFTAEWNASGFASDGSAKFFFGEKSGTIGGYITIVGKEIKLFAGDELLGVGTLKNNFNFDKLVTIRLACDGGHYKVFFNNLLKIDVQGKKAVLGGRIGYDGFAYVGATTFSNDAFDSSDCYDPKPVEKEGKFFASAYLEESNVNSGSGVYDIGYDYDDIDVLYSEAKAVKLANKGDYLLYPLDVAKDALYGFELVHKQSNAGSRISIQIDNDYPIVFDIHAVDFSGNSSAYEQDMLFIKQFFAEIEMTKGLHTMKIELVSGELDLEYISIFEDSKYKPDYSNPLGELVDHGADYLCLWKVAEMDGYKCHMSKSGANSIVLFGSPDMTDLDVSVDIKLTVASQSQSCAGILTRCTNPSLDSFGIDQSAQGYFTGISRIALRQFRFNYDDNTVNNLNGSYMNQWHNLRVVSKGNKISTYLDGQLAFTYTDSNPFSHGYVALYSINSQSYFRNLVIKGI